MRRALTTVLGVLTAVLAGCTYVAPFGPPLPGGTITLGTAAWRLFNLQAVRVSEVGGADDCAPSWTVSVLGQGTEAAFDFPGSPAPSAVTSLPSLEEASAGTRVAPTFLARDWVDVALYGGTATADTLWDDQIDITMDAAFLCHLAAIGAEPGPCIAAPPAGLDLTVPAGVHPTCYEALGPGPLVEGGQRLCAAGSQRPCATPLPSP